jgi:hypothetical protein
VNGNAAVQKVQNLLSMKWVSFISADTDYWQFCDANRQLLYAATRYGARDAVLLVPLLANLLLDLLIFHSMAEYFIRQLLPGAHQSIILLAAGLFPLCYIWLEFKFAELIHLAKEEHDRYSYGTALYWVITWYVAGILWAALPSAVFAYVMSIGQQDSGLSTIMIAIMCLLGLLLHLLIVLGGEPVVEAKERLFARWKQGRLGKQRQRCYRDVVFQAGRTKEIAIHFAREARDLGKSGDFIGLSPGSLRAIHFVDGCYYGLHPMQRPAEYRFGANGGTSGSLPGC